MPIPLEARVRFRLDFGGRQTSTDYLHQQDAFGGKACGNQPETLSQRPLHPSTLAGVVAQFLPHRCGLTSPHIRFSFPHVSLAKMPSS